ncbi:MAG: hypothetical protein GF315_03315, partial [candidate division Zixibacteria bacterium]|nr:hypothetical protein [candidate division Zixibacteria bacterium]
MLSLFGILLVSLLSTLAFTPVAMYAARRLGYLDQPGVRKVHITPTPLMGGAAVFIGFSIAFLLGFFAAGLVDNGVLRGYIIGAALIFAVGLIDDAVGITPGSKLIGQVLAAVLFLTFSGAGAIIMNSPLDITIGLLWMVTLMNALNFLDNMDGLCSGISFSAALGFTILGFSISHLLLTIMGIALMGTLIGFMYFNLNPAKIFLGDAGSMFLGYTLAAMGIMFAVSHSSPQDLLVPLLIMSYPLFDISFVTFTRFREGRSVAQPGKDHTSHRLVDLGVRSTRAVWQIFLISCALAILGNILYKGIDATWKLIVVTAVAFILLIFGVHLHRRFTNLFQKISLILLDLIGINITFVLFYILRFHSDIFEVSVNIAMVEYVPAAIWISFYWLFIFGIFGQYEFEWDRIYRFELVKLLKTVLVGSGIFVLLALDFTSTFWSLLFHLTFYALLLFLVVGTLRLLFLFSVGKYYLSYDGKRKTILVGSKDSEEWFRQMLVKKEIWGIDIIGRVNYNTENGGALGTIDNLRDLIREHRAAEVLVLEPIDDKTRLRDMLGCG